VPGDHDVQLPARGRHPTLLATGDSGVARFLDPASRSSGAGIDAGVAARDIDATAARELQRPLQDLGKRSGHGKQGQLACRALTTRFHRTLPKNF
jgi:hypothetical protein